MVILSYHDLSTDGKHSMSSCFRFAGCLKH